MLNGVNVTELSQTIGMVKAVGPKTPKMKLGESSIRNLANILLLLVFALLCGCGGGAGTSSSAAPPPPPPQVTVPNVVGDTQAAATTAITGAGLVFGTFNTASSPTVAFGNVISESPSAGTSVNSGSAVNLVVSTGPPQAPPPPQQNLTILHTFEGGPEGEGPWGLILDSSGSLYGTTSEGGDLACPEDANGCGTVFKVDAAGVFTTLHVFAGAPSDGANPRPSLIFDAAGNLYGGTFFGGAHEDGIVFKLNTSGNETVLHDFTGGVDGFSPDVAVQDAAGNLFGVTGFNFNFVECTSDCGSVFKLDSSGTLTTLHTFNGVDGDTPGPLIADAAGNLYGTTFFGGNNLACTVPIAPLGCGTVFKLDSSGVFTTLHAFSGDGLEGKAPTGVLALDETGNLYGATAGGGRGFGGTVFKLDANGQITTLHNFNAGFFDDGTDPGGAEPQGGVLLDAMGNLYGTTLGGGAPGWGVIFELDKSGVETALHTFTDSVDGGQPLGPLVVDGDGNLYGTATVGGDLTCQPPNGCGIVFKMKLP